MWDECRAGREREEGPPNLSLLHCSLPSLGVLACMEQPLCLSRKSLEVNLLQEAGSFCTEEQMAPCPKVGQSHVLQKRHKCLSELPQVSSILPLPPTGTLSCTLWCCLCLFSNWGCRDTPEDEKAHDKDRKAAARRSPMEMLHLLHLFLFCWYFNLSAKTSSKLQDLAWSFVFSADFSAYHHILLCSRQCVLLGFFWHQATWAGAIGRLWYIKNR